MAESPDLSEFDETDQDDNDPVRKSKRSNPRSIALHESDSEASAKAEEDDDVGGWGTSKKDYYNADAIETEADALEEEAEARRLQQKQLQGLTEEDFGFDEVDWLETGKGGIGEGDDNGSGDVTVEILPQLEITDAMGPEERLKILKTRYPEFEPLAKEFVDLQALHEDLKVAASATTALQLQAQSKLNGDESAGAEGEKPSIAILKQGALGAYLAALCMYFALLTSNAGDENKGNTTMLPTTLHDHAVMETLVQCRDLWGKIKHISVPEQHASFNGFHNLSNGGISLKHDQKSIAKDHNELTQPKEKRKKARKTKAQKAFARAQVDAEARRIARIEKTEEDLLSLSALIPTSSALRKPSRPPQSTKSRDPSPGFSSDFGEQTTLTAQEAEEKAKRKKSLRFYTSQITQKSQKRDNAGRNAGGDDDLPYRERLRDRQARLTTETEGRGKKGKRSLEGEALGGESDEEDRRAADELREGEKEEDYYGVVTARSSAKKAQKAALAASTNEALLGSHQPHEGDENQMTADGKRAITYAIEKNKGLAPRRKKEVRNPRVKKRKKYEEKMKKLGSVRKVYKEGGEGRGGYGGEKTGITKGLVRSIKL